MYVELGLELRPHQKSFFGAHAMPGFDDSKVAFADETILCEPKPHEKYFHAPNYNGEGYFREADIGFSLGVVVGVAEDKVEHFLENVNLPELHRPKSSVVKDITTITHVVRVLKPLILLSKVQTLLHKARIYHRG